MSTDTGNIYMIGLKNPAGIACENEACLGKLSWEDGSDFDVYPAGATMKFRVDQVCSRVDGPNNQIRTFDASQCDGQERRFICNYKCPEGQPL